MDNREGESGAPTENIKPKLINWWKGGWFSLGYVKYGMFCSRASKKLVVPD